VFDQVRSAVATLKAAARELEPRLLDGPDAAALLEEVAEGKHVCAAIEAVLAKRVDESGAWRSEGHRSAAHWLAAKTGVSVGPAMRTLETAAALEVLSATNEAFRAGRLSETQAHEITGAALADRRSEAELLSVAAGHGVKGLKDRCREVRAKAEPDDLAWARRLHTSRYLRRWTAHDGARCGEYRLVPETGARVDSAIDAHLDRIFRDASSAGRRESRDAYAADALVAVAAEGPCKPIETKMTLDATAARRTYALPGERCEIDGVGPIPVTTALGLLNDASMTLMLREGNDITTVTKATRLIPRALRRWLEQQYPKCGHKACDNDLFLEIDHVIPVEAHGPTAKHNLWRVCPYCHKLKHLFGWKVIGEPGNWDLVPPDHPDDPDPP
jgi:hypothetical protein